MSYCLMWFVFQMYFSQELLRENLSNIKKKKSYMGQALKKQFQKANIKLSES